MNHRALRPIPAAILGFCLWCLSLAASARPIIKFIEGPNDGDPFTIEATGWDDVLAINMMSAEEAFVVVTLDLPLTGPPLPDHDFIGYVIDDPVSRHPIDRVGVRAIGNFDSSSGGSIIGPHIHWILQFYFDCDSIAYFNGGSPFPTGFPAAIADGNLTLMNDYMFELGAPWSDFGIDLYIQSERPTAPTTSVPEPASLALFSTGLFVSMQVRRRSRRGELPRLC